MLHRGAMLSCGEATGPLGVVGTPPVAADHALGDQPLERVKDVIRENRVEVADVQLVQVDPSGIQSPQAVGAGSFDCSAADVSPLQDVPGALVDPVAELRREDDVGSPVADRSPEQRLAVAGTVGGCSVEERDTTGHRRLQRADRFVVVHRTPPSLTRAHRPGPPDRPAPDTQSADPDAASAQRPGRGILLLVYRHGDDSDSWSALQVK